MSNFNAIEIKDRIVTWIREWFDNNGKECKAVIGISGGADSTVVAALCVEALGKERVFGVLMPCGEQKDISDALRLVEHLGIEYVIVNIADAVGAVQKEVKDALNQQWSTQSAINLPPRIRMTTLYAVSQTVNGRVANTCNLSEDWVGYSTRYGDSVGDFSPLSHITKTEVKQIGMTLELPRELVYKTPSDGLCGKTDEENLGFTYEVLDRYIREGICEDTALKEKIDMLHQKNLFKLQLMPAFEL